MMVARQSSPPGRGLTMKRKIMSTWLFLFSAFMFLAVFIDGSFAGSGHYNGWYTGYHMMSWPGMGWMMIFFWVLVLMVLVFLIKWMMSITRNESPDSNGANTALNILKERYARGEIDKQEFESMRRTLSEG